MFASRHLMLLGLLALGGAAASCSTRAAPASIRCDAGHIFGMQFGFDGHTGAADGIIPSAITGDLHTWSHTQGVEQGDHFGSPDIPVDDLDIPLLG